jgi:uncharacterized membrane protein YfcA
VTGPLHVALLFGAGLVAGTVNVLAGGGSFLTLPVLIFVGLPPGIANATNRVGVLLQNVGAVWGFHRHRVLPWRVALWASVPAMAGAVVGTWGALEIGDDAFRQVLAFLMVAVTLWSLWKSPKEAPGADAGGMRPWVLAAGFFGVGVYGGFVQAGVGFFILAATTAAGLDLVRGNAVKVLAVLALTAVSLAIFAWQGRVEWLPGLALAAGNTLGGLVGVRLAVRKGHAWLRRVVTACIILFAVKLLLQG